MDGVILNTRAEIKHECRISYSWFTNLPAELLEEDSPQWHNTMSSSTPVELFIN
jgi:hypothetical protein